MKSQEKSWRTRKVKDNQKKTGSRVWMHRKNLTIGAKDLLKKWDDEALRKDVCVVCGDGTPRRILITHHLDPDSVSEGKITLCASCHNVFNKAKETTSPEEIERDLNLRHQTYQYNVRRILN
ncbi:hypothetical protein MUO79_10995 [Candidatus Bathyarchaeota archaeon]|jgi:hypothetical protein|nr:hypothetical protein [Candidatus Bathyarchaeota archaeon]